MEPRGEPGKLECSYWKSCLMISLGLSLGKLYNWVASGYQKEQCLILKQSVALLSELPGMDLYEDYKSPFDFNAGVDRNYLYLSPGISLTPPGSPTLSKSGNCF
ncbi:hypothetical protein ASZ78_010744 [Callipepla squamata]|uniref:Uncharacterized protein n=1 Tax=Callipepla squamata TaxID=9009 RepID=A0A226N1Z4_CALSU|nr:hypothetical protein ASZ78_010744 [Callipepla squamata]